MPNSYEINFHNEVVPYSDGRMSTDTRAWRDATDLELQQYEQIQSLNARLEAAGDLLDTCEDVLRDCELDALANRIREFRAGGDT